MCVCVAFQHHTPSGIRYKNIRSISLHIHISDTQRSKTQSYPTFGSSAPLFEAWILRASDHTIHAAYVETRICVEYVQV